MVAHHWGNASAAKANYGTCSKAAECRYDHGHCHRCLQLGHWANSCTGLEPSSEPSGEVSEATYSQCSPLAESLYDALRAGGREIPSEKIAAGRARISGDWWRLWCLFGGVEAAACGQLVVAIRYIL